MNKGYVIKRSAEHCDEVAVLFQDANVGLPYESDISMEEQQWYGRIVPLDGDSYSLEEDVIESQEWNDPVEGIEKEFLVVVIGGCNQRMNWKR